MTLSILNKHLIIIIENYDIYTMIYQHYIYEKDNQIILANLAWQIILKQKIMGHIPKAAVGECDNSKEERFNTA